MLTSAMWHPYARKVLAADEEIKAKAGAGGSMQKLAFLTESCEMQDLGVAARLCTFTEVRPHSTPAEARTRTSAATCVPSAKRPRPT